MKVTTEVIPSSKTLPTGLMEEVLVGIIIRVPTTGMPAMAAQEVPAGQALQVPTVRMGPRRPEGFQVEKVRATPPVISANQMANGMPEVARVTVATRIEAGNPIILKEAEAMLNVTIRIAATTVIHTVAEVMAAVLLVLL